MRRMTPSIHDLRPTRAIEEELEWFFNTAESDMGARSNFMAMIGRAVPITPEDAVEACSRYRRIRAWLKGIMDSDAGVLQAAYELRDWPVVLYDKLGRLTGIVVRLACALDRWPDQRGAQQALEMIRAGWLAAECSVLNPTFSRLRGAAQVRFARAHLAYRTVRREETR
jgi:hypothetical protein